MSLEMVEWCTCFLVYLDCRLVSLDSDDLADKLVMAYSTLRTNIGVRTFACAGGSSFDGSLTSSYMAHPIMFSATTTGPATEKTEPY